MEDVSIKKRELHFRRRPKKLEGSADLSEHQRAAILGGGERFFKYVNICTKQLSFPPLSFRPQVLILETEQYHNFVSSARDIKCKYQHTVYICGVTLYVWLCIHLFFIYFGDFFHAALLFVMVESYFMYK